MPADSSRASEKLPEALPNRKAFQNGKRSWNKNVRII
jgi:hypothetical protein